MIFHILWRTCSRSSIRKRQPQYSCINLFNNVQSILNYFISLYQWHLLRLRVSEPFEMAVSSLLLKLFVCLCACENLSFTMTNGIVFHTYDSLLQLFHCVNHLRPKSCVPWLGPVFPLFHVHSFKWGTTRVKKIEQSQMVCLFVVKTIVS